MYEEYIIGIFFLIEYDALFLSNGPGDPSICEAAIANLRELLTELPDIPVFGICMGHQILSLAAGCKSYKMKYLLHFFINIFVYSM